MRNVFALLMIVSGTLCPRHPPRQPPEDQAAPPVRRRLHWAPANNLSKPFKIFLAPARAPRLGWIYLRVHVRHHLNKVDKMRTGREPVFYAPTARSLPPAQ